MMIANMEQYEAYMGRLSVLMSSDDLDENGEAELEMIAAEIEEYEHYVLSRNGAYTVPSPVKSTTFSI